MRNRKHWPRGAWVKLQNALILVALMQDREMSMATLARYAGCSKGFISHLTSGRRTTCTPQLAERIAEALKVPLEVLFVPSVATVERQSVKQTTTSRGAVAA